MPVMRASRPESKQRIGDLLYEQLKTKHGKLAGKVVGMLLEGLSHEGLASICKDPVALDQLVVKTAPLLEIQRLDLADKNVTDDGLQLLALLVLFCFVCLRCFSQSLWIIMFWSVSREHRRRCWNETGTRALTEQTPAGP